jgi:cysteinyl-tRNA synthetase
LAISFDEVLGLGLQGFQIEEVEIPKEAQKLAEDREVFRKAGKFEDADKVRKSLLKMGYLIEDTPKGPKLKRLKQ